MKGRGEVWRQINSMLYLSPSPLGYKNAQISKLHFDQFSSLLIFSINFSNSVGGGVVVLALGIGEGMWANNAPFENASNYIICKLKSSKIMRMFLIYYNFHCIKG